MRAVTPESATSANFDLTALPSPTSFPPQSYTRVPAKDHSASVSNTDEESALETRRRRTKKKSSQKDEFSSDASPNSFFEKTRKRLGSITTAPTQISRSEEPVASIGFPSVVQASSLTEAPNLRHQMPRTPRRAFSSENTNTLSSTALRSPLPLDTDSSRILHLMKTTCGRMHGILFYRPIGTTSWHSGYCAINVAPGSLVCQEKGDVSKNQVLIPDLRGCRVRSHYDPQAQITYLSLVLPASGLGFQLRPPVSETLDSWLAALLCWQPLRPKGIHNKMTKPQPVLMTDRKTMEHRRMSDMVSPRSTAIVKVGQILLWDDRKPASYTHGQPLRPSSPRPPQLQGWQRVGCTLHDNGTFKLLADGTAKPLRLIRLNTLLRSAIQRLDESVLNCKYCLAIFPQYTVQGSIASSLKPIILCLESKVAFEAWYVLLRALTVPELYGPEACSQALPEESPVPDDHYQSQDMFRIERNLTVKITEAKLAHSRTESSNHHPTSGRAKPATPEKSQVDLYADVVLGMDLRARTSTKSCAPSAFWAEEYIIEDLPSILSQISVAVKVGNPGEKEWTMVTKDGHELPEHHDIPAVEDLEIASHDPVIGRVEVQLTQLEQEKIVEKWWPLLDGDGNVVGQLLMKLALAEQIVLMESEYEEISTLLHRFDNSLTTQIAQALGPELKQLSDVLLDIFQSSGKVDEWINTLIEEEIDGIHREPPPVRMRFSGRIHSNDSYESAEQRELLVRDLSRSATMEANLLFRGNSLVTKALDAHMRRLGREYLAQTIGDQLRAIVSDDLDCEVDPVRVRVPDQLSRNWSNLIGLTSSLWQSISKSAEMCPPGMRTVMKHIRSCAEDRYGSFIRTVKYTSVSGFLFLRFFCPAILNPRLFGLIDGKCIRDSWILQTNTLQNIRQSGLVGH